MQFQLHGEEDSVRIDFYHIVVGPAVPLCLGNLVPCLRKGSPIQPTGSQSPRRVHGGAEIGQRTRTDTITKVDLDIAEEQRSITCEDALALPGLAPHEGQLLAVAQHRREAEERGKLRLTEHLACPWLPELHWIQGMLPRLASLGACRPICVLLVAQEALVVATLGLAAIIASICAADVSAVSARLRQLALFEIVLTTGFMVNAFIVALAAASRIIGAAAAIVSTTPQFSGRLCRGDDGTAVHTSGADPSVDGLPGGRPCRRRLPQPVGGGDALQGAAERRQRGSPGGGGAAASVAGGATGAAGGGELSRVGLPQRAADRVQDVGEACRGPRQLGGMPLSGLIRVLLLVAGLILLGIPFPRPPLLPHGLYQGSPSSLVDSDVVCLLPDLMGLADLARIRLQF
mmetsp:Transcript_140924/g.366826  ORF Transcript_140924/g.366826 Transcript_140924/m.366826 type:complete len:402 (-) Transcript_140924:354-1559(-)